MVNGGWALNGKRGKLDGSAGVDGVLGRGEPKEGV